MRLLKANHNTVSFAEIERNEFRHKKELSLPPITQVVRDLNLNGSPLKEGSSKLSSYNQITPIGRGGAAAGNSLTVPPSPRPAEVIDEIHRLRLAIHDKTEADKNAVR